MEIDESKDVYDRNSFYYELKHGTYHNSEKINKILVKDGININNI